MLFRKMWRDLLKNRTQFVSIFLMALLSMLVFVGLDAESSGADKAVNKYYDSHNFADIWIMGAGFSEDDMRIIKKVKGVKDAEREIYLTGSVNMDDNPYMYVEFFTTNNISQMLLYEGERYEEGAEGIWLEKWFCDKNHINLGDKFSFTTNGMTVDTIVKGIMDSPEYVYYVSEEDVMYPNYARCCLGFLSDSSYPVSPVTYNKVRVTIKDGYDSEFVKKSIENAFDRDDIAVTDRDQCLSYATFHSETQQHEAFGVMFAVIFVLIALLGITTTMARVTSNQRTQIGTLKALGFTKKKITWHYMSYGIVISIVGSIVGALIGYIAIPNWILSMFEGAYLVPDLKGAFTTRSFYVMTLSVIVSAFVSYLSCRKELKDPPAVTLRPPAAKKIRTSRLEKSKLWLSLSFSTQWNIRDVFRNKLRSVMGILGVVGCSLLLLCGFGCFDSINGLLDKMYGELMTANNKVMLASNTSYDYSYDFSKKYKGQMIQELSIELVSNSASKNGSCTVIDAGNYVHFQDKNLKNISLTKSGIAMSYKMTQNLGVTVGDTIRWHVIGDDKWHTTRIAQIYRDPSIQGLSMYRDVYEELECDFEPTSILTNMSLPKDITDEDQISSVMNISDMKVAFAETLEMMYSMIYVMVAAAMTLGFIVLYNLGVLSFVEKTREVATLKVLGFPSGKIRNILQKQNIWLTVVGIIFGIWAGIGVLTVICSTVSDSLDMFPIVNIPTYLYTIVGTFFVSISVNFMFSKKVKTIDMVDALKGVE